MHLGFSRLVLKPIIFQLLPRILKETWRVTRSTVVIVSPLFSIMKDQVQELSRLGLNAVAIRLGCEERERATYRWISWPLVQK